MQNLIKNGLAILLKNINFENVATTETKKINYVDQFKTVFIEPDFAEFEITRLVSVDIRHAYNLKVVAGVQVFAKDGIDLTKSLNEKVIEENRNTISSTVMNFISALVTQITGSFNEIPIITPPSLKLEETNQQKNK